MFEVSALVSNFLHSFPSPRWTTSSTEAYLLHSSLYLFASALYNDMPSI